MIRAVSKARSRSLV